MRCLYASVEKRDNPELADKPVIVGGGKRGVVSTACYIARIHGVRSAMPMFKALEACPDAVVIKPDMEKYSRVGREIRTMMQELTPLVQPLSIDEAFLDLSGTEKLHHDPPARVLAKFTGRVEKEVGVSVSAGLSYCKFLAKVASDLQKPRGFSVVGEAEALSFLAARPVTTIWGVGKAFAATLEADGIRMIAQLQEMEESELMRRYGVMGQRLFRLARGIDERHVHNNDPVKSVSSETTFFHDISRHEDLVPILRSLSEKVAWRLKKSGIAGQTVVLKMKTADFKSRTRNRRLDDPTQLADRIFRTGLALLEKKPTARNSASSASASAICAMPVLPIRPISLTDRPRGGPRRRRQWTSCAISSARAASRLATPSAPANRELKATMRTFPPTCAMYFRFYTN